MSNIYIYEKTKKVLESCKTVEQLIHGLKFLELATKTCLSTKGSRFKWHNDFLMLELEYKSKLKQLKVQDNLRNGVRWNLNNT